MTKELKRVSLVVAMMFIALFVSSSFVQGAGGQSYANDPRNVRSIYDSYKTLRGPILIDGKPIASSIDSDDAYRYQGFMRARFIQPSRDTSRSLEEQPVLSLQ